MLSGISSCEWLTTPCRLVPLFQRFPHGYNPATPTPVMVGYSAFEDSTENFRNYSRLREPSVGRDAIIVYPRAIGASWEGSPTASTGPGQDIAFVRVIIDDVQRYYNIDRRGQRVMPVPELFASYEHRNRCIGGVEVIKVHGSNHFWWHDPSAKPECAYRAAPFARYDCAHD